MTSTNWEFIDHVSSVVTACANLALAVYVFIYSNYRDRKNDKDTAETFERTIKIQSFKDIIIQPHLQEILFTFENITSIESKIVSLPFIIANRISINESVKSNTRLLRQKFINAVLLVDGTLGHELILLMDELTDTITFQLFNRSVDLSSFAEYDSLVGKKISDTRNQVLAKLYSYRGK